VITYEQYDAHESHRVCHLIVNYAVSASAFILIGPTGGFTGGLVTEQETFCFYDSSIWTPSLTPPAPCSNGQTAVTLTPASLAFPPHPTGTTSAPLQATLTNTGGAALVFTSLGRPGDFYGSWNCPRILQPGASCTITVAITPSAAGTPRGTVLITDNAPGSHQKAAAGGYGVPSGTGIEIAGV
jgi:hypothetical protein